MKNKFNNLILWVLISFFIASCTKKTISVSIQDTSIQLKVNQRTGNWAFTNTQETSTIKFMSGLMGTIDMKTFENNFLETASINKIRKNGGKNGIWISSSAGMVEICHYKKGVKHGRCLNFLTNKETIDCNYKHGKLNGWCERKLDGQTFYKQHFKAGIPKKEIIISPKW